MGRTFCTVLVAIVLSLGATPNAACAQNQVCSGLLPIPVVPIGSSGFLTGCQPSVIYGPGSQGDGSFGLCDFPACELGDCGGLPPVGSNTWRCQIARGYGCCIEIGQVLVSEPATTLGIVRQNLQERWDADSDQRTWICFADYTGNGQRVLSLPVTTPIPIGRSQVTVTGFAVALLIERPSGGQGPLILEFQPTGVVSSHAPTWGQIRTRYR